MEALTQLLFIAQGGLVVLFFEALPIILITGLICLVLGGLLIRRSKIGGGFLFVVGLVLVGFLIWLFT